MANFNHSGLLFFKQIRIERYFIYLILYRVLEVFGSKSRQSLEVINIAVRLKSFLRFHLEIC